MIKKNVNTFSHGSNWISSNWSIHYSVKVHIKGILENKLVFFIAFQTFIFFLILENLGGGVYRVEGTNEVDVYLSLRVIHSLYSLVLAIYKWLYGLCPRYLNITTGETSWKPQVLWWYMREYNVKPRITLYCSINWLHAIKLCKTVN